MPNKSREETINLIKNSQHTDKNAAEVTMYLIDGTIDANNHWNEYEVSGMLDEIANTVIEDAKADAVVTRAELEAMGIRALKKYASENNIDIDGLTTKETIIRAILGE